MGFVVNLDDSSDIFIQGDKSDQTILKVAECDDDRLFIKGLVQLQTDKKLYLLQDQCLSRLLIEALGKPCLEVIGFNYFKYFTEQESTLEITFTDPRRPLENSMAGTANLGSNQVNIFCL